jgi:hypothetical protein
MARHPNNGPSLSKPTIKKPRPTPPSLAQVQSAREQEARDADKSRSVHHELKKDGIVAYLKRRGK